MLRDFFKYVIDQRLDLSKENIDTLFEIMGYLRHKVAVECQDIDANLMGRMEAGAGIVDPVSDNKQWNSWKEAEEKLIKELYKNPNDKILFKVENGKGEFSAKGSVRYSFDYEITDDNEINPSNIYCWHQTKTDDDCQKIFRHIQLILDFPEQGSTAELQDLLGSLFWEANQVSIYGRGQGTTTECLDNSLAQAKGYKLDILSNFNIRAGGVNPAFLYVVKKEMIEFFKNNTALVPIIDPNLNEENIIHPIPESNTLDDSSLIIGNISKDYHLDFNEQN